MVWRGEREAGVGVQNDCRKRDKQTPLEKKINFCRSRKSLLGRLILKREYLVKIFACAIELGKCDHFKVLSQNSTKLFRGGAVASWLVRSTPDRYSLLLHAGKTGAKRRPHGPLGPVQRMPYSHRVSLSEWLHISTLCNHTSNRLMKAERFSRHNLIPRKTITVRSSQFF